MYVCRKMIQRNSPFNKKQNVSVIRDFPQGCGTQSSVKNQRNEIGSEVVGVKSETREKINGCVSVADQNYNSLKEDESVDLIMKKAGFNVSGNSSNVGSGRFVSSTKRKFHPSCESKVKTLSSEEAIKLIASQRRRRRLSYSSSTIQRKSLLQKQINSPEKKNNKKKKMFSNADALRAKTHKPSQHRDEIRPNQVTGLVPTKVVISPREKVLEVLRVFKRVYRELDRGESKNSIDHKTRTILVKEGKQVNRDKRIGAVPGVKVGDEFQYKSELSLIGLHFDIMGGIDYMKRGEMKVATSIVSSEGNGYKDLLEWNVIIYTGEGGNVRLNDEKVVEDQKLVNGNLALVNSMKEKSPVRVIIGKIRSDKRGKRYVYDGLYLVKDYWKERGAQGNVLFKFKLFRIHNG